jgi:hypothetical protein
MSVQDPPLRLHTTLSGTPNSSDCPLPWQVAAHLILDYLTAIVLCCWLFGDDTLDAFRMEAFRNRVVFGIVVSINFVGVALRRLRRLWRRRQYKKELVQYFGGGTTIDRTIEGTGIIEPSFDTRHDLLADLVAFYNQRDPSKAANASDLLRDNTPGALAQRIQSKYGEVPHGWESFLIPYDDDEDTWWGGGRGAPGGGGGRSERDE